MGRVFCYRHAMLDILAPDYFPFGLPVSRQARESYQIGDLAGSRVYRARALAQLINARRLNRADGAPPVYAGQSLCRR